MAAEPPFRLLVRAVLEQAPVSRGTKAFWDAVERPHYYLGLWRGAQQAIAQGERAICAVELGVASGEGLLALQEHAVEIEQRTGVQIHIFGFDLGTGLPEPSDYRDHADWWQAGDYPMDAAELRRHLQPRTTLILGDVAETIPEFVEHSQPAPVGFVAFDLDLYTSTRAGLTLFELPGSHMLHRVPLYFDDLYWDRSHRFAGEQLALDEFNAENETVKIDRWHGLRYGRPFPESRWLDQMHQLHDLRAASQPEGERAPRSARAPTET